MQSKRTKKTKLIEENFSKPQTVLI